MGDYCAFCDPREFENSIVFKSQSFLVFPSLGQITEGYLSIVPRKHTLCFGCLTFLELHELSAVQNWVRENLLKVYGKKTTFFEHGLLGQSVRHAHMHAVPTETDILDCLKWDLLPEGRGSKLAKHEIIHDLTQLKDMFDLRGPYLFYERFDGKRFIFHPFIYPQYFRHILARELRVPERADWRQMNRKLDNELIKNTVQKLTPQAAQ